MLISVDAVALLRAILADDCPTDTAAQKHLAAAARAQMDPLDYCSHQFGLGNAVTGQRAARWAGYCFANVLPSYPQFAQGRIDGVANLGHVRSVRQRVLGEDLTFIAPRFDNVLRLKVSWTAELFRKVRFAPPEAIETAVTRAASEQLMDAARQNITSRWPEASAAVSLPIIVRVGFVVGLAVLILLVMLAGIIARPLLIPAVAILLMTPGVLRLLAALPAPAPPPPPLLADTELPIYSVLIPLRDESQMVPMLKRAMSAIDYPALCIKSTKSWLLLDICDLPRSWPNADQQWSRWRCPLQYPCARRRLVSSWRGR